MSIHLRDIDADVVLLFLENTRKFASVQASMPNADMAKAGVGLAMVIDSIVSVLRSRELEATPEDRERAFLRSVALGDQLEAFGGEP